MGRTQCGRWHVLEIPKIDNRQNLQVEAEAGIITDYLISCLPESFFRRRCLETTLDNLKIQDVIPAKAENFNQHVVI
jgi:hypothetical protein